MGKLCKKNVFFEYSSVCKRNAQAKTVYRNVIMNNEKVVNELSFFQ